MSVTAGPCVLSTPWARRTGIQPSALPHSLTRCPIYSGPWLPQQQVLGLGFEPRLSGSLKCAVTAVAAGWLEAWAQEMGRPGFHP